MPNPTSPHRTIIQCVDQYFADSSPSDIEPLPVPRYLHNWNDLPSEISFKIKPQRYESAVGWWRGWNQRLDLWRSTLNYDDMEDFSHTLASLWNLEKKAERTNPYCQREQIFSTGFSLLRTAWANSLQLSPHLALPCGQCKPRLSSRIYLLPYKCQRRNTDPDMIGPIWQIRNCTSYWKTTPNLNLVQIFKF